MHLRNFQLFYKTFSKMLRLLHANLTTTNPRPQVSSFQCLRLRFAGWQTQRKGCIRFFFVYSSTSTESLFHIKLKFMWAGNESWIWEFISKRAHSVCCQQQVTDAQLCQCPQGMLSTCFSLADDGAQTQPKGKVNRVHFRLSGVCFWPLREGYFNNTPKELLQSVVFKR